MFTGIVQTMGRIEAAENRGSETRFRICPTVALSNIEIGESIAVNGVCLTVETDTGNGFTAYASAETMSLTNLGELRVGSTVNLERAMAMGDRFGGHIVSGHVDCRGEVVSVVPAGQSFIYRIAIPSEHGRFVIPKGSVCLDGISLTVNQCDADWLEVNIIPETQRATTISGWKPGAKINVETDVIGKYVLRMVAPWQGRDGSEPDQGTITEDFLKNNGFFNV